MATGPRGRNLPGFQALGAFEAPLLNSIHHPPPSVRTAVSTWVRTHRWTHGLAEAIRSYVEPLHIDQAGCPAKPIVLAFIRKLGPSGPFANGSRTSFCRVYICCAVISQNEIESSADVGLSERVPSVVAEPNGNTQVIRGGRLWE